MNKLVTNLVIGTLFLVPSLALAASIQLTPSTVTVVAGQTFTVTVTATPSGTPLYTSSANIQFNSNILSATAFSLAPTWIAVTQSGYDLMDNTNGTVIKTGGYPAGFSSPTVLGTLTFRAKQAGKATITVDGNSILLDGGSNNELSGSQGSVTVTVANASAPTTPATQGTAQVPVPNNAIVPTSGSTTSATTATGTNQEAAAALVATSSQTAAVAEAFNGVPAWVWWTLLAVIVLGAIYWAWRRYRAA
ncbi:MAG: cohesin domain-containing protein [Candidatus Pacebacteria bacterium]|nr:cohesin domain-containing protein [Candidatus Paceibacterota bacterium]